MQYLRLSEVKMSEHINKRVYVIFMCKDVQLKERNDGKAEYMNISMKDKCVEECNAKLFSPSKYHKEIIKRGMVYRAAVDVQEYEKAQKGYTCKIYNMELLSEDSTDFMDWYENIGVAAEKVTNYIGQLNGSIYFGIVYKIITDRWEKFIRYPAAKSMHHTKLGGLCVHTAEVVEISTMIGKYITDNYGNNIVDMDLIIASALLHDVGKCLEFDVDLVSGNTGYASVSALESHITSTAIDITEYCVKNKLGKYSDSKDEAFKEDEQMKIELLRHCILSHHGKKEYGSPVEPAIIEAMVLNEADKLSAEISRFTTIMENMELYEVSSLWNNGKIMNIFKK